MELMWSSAIGGWMLTTLPHRVSTWRARYLASEGRCVLNDGLPYRLDTCRACGGELPFMHHPDDAASTED